MDRKNEGVEIFKETSSQIRNLNESYPSIETNETQVPYEFVIQTLRSYEVSYIESRVNSATKQALAKSLIYNNNIFHQIIDINVESDVKINAGRRSLCIQRTDPPLSCYYVNVTVSVDHASSISNQIIRYFILKHHEDVGPTLEFPMVKYIGLEVFTFTITFFINGVSYRNNVSSIDIDIPYFQTSIQTLLNKKLLHEKQEINVATVAVIKQNLINAESSTQKVRKRRLKADSKSFILEMETELSGDYHSLHYSPYDSIITNTLVSSKNLTSTLKINDKFVTLQNIYVGTVTSSVIGDSNEKSKSGIHLIIITVIVVLIIVIALFVLRNKKRGKKNVPYAEVSSSERNEVEDDTENNTSTESKIKPRRKSRRLMIDHVEQKELTRNKSESSFKSKLSREKGNNGESTSNSNGRYRRNSFKTKSVKRSKSASSVKSESKSRENSSDESATRSQNDKSRPRTEVKKERSNRSINSADERKESRRKDERKETDRNARRSSTTECIPSRPRDQPRLRRHSSVDFTPSNHIQARRRHSHVSREDLRRRDMNQNVPRRRPSRIEERRESKDFEHPNLVRDRRRRASFAEGDYCRDINRRRYSQYDLRPNRDSHLKRRESINEIRKEYKPTQPDKRNIKENTQTLESRTGLRSTTPQKKRVTREVGDRTRSKADLTEYQSENESISSESFDKNHDRRRSQSDSRPSRDSPSKKRETVSQNETKFTQPNKIHTKEKNRASLESRTERRSISPEKKISTIEPADQSVDESVISAVESIKSNKQRLSDRHICEENESNKSKSISSNKTYDKNNKLQAKETKSIWSDVSDEDD